MEKNQKIVVLLVTSLLLLGIALTFALTLYMTKEDKGGGANPKEPPTEDPMESPVELEPDDGTLATDDVEADEEKPKTAEQIFKKPEKKNTTTMTERDALLHETTSRELFRSFEFLEGHDYLTEQVAIYSEEGEGKLIHQLHRDSAMLANLGHVMEAVHEEGHVTDVDGMYSILSGIEDPEMSLLGMLNVGVPARNELLLSYDSINPVFDDQVIVFGIAEETDEILIREINQVYEAENIYHIEFEVDDSELYAVVVENPAGYSYVYGIYEVEEGSTVFLTVREWMDLEKLLEEEKEKKNEKEGTETNE